MKRHISYLLAISGLVLVAVIFTVISLGRTPKADERADLLTQKNITKTTKFQVIDTGFELRNRENIGLSSYDGDMSINNLGTVMVSGINIDNENDWNDTGFWRQKKQSITSGALINDKRTVDETKKINGNGTVIGLNNNDLIIVKKIDPLTRFKMEIKSVWTDKSAMILDLKEILDNFSPYFPGTILFMNDKQLVTGKYVNSGTGSSAFVWSKNKGAKLLDNIGITDVKGLNNRGDIIGLNYTYPMVDGYVRTTVHPSVYIAKTGKSQNIVENYLPIAINNAGIVVGERPNRKGFYFDSGSAKNTDIEPRLFDINSKNIAVGAKDYGWAGNITSDTSAVVYSIDKQEEINLNDLISQNSGWKLKVAHSINDAGWIAGVGQLNNDSKYRVVMLKPE